MEILSIFLIISIPLSISALCSKTLRGGPDYPYRKFQSFTAYDESERGDITQYIVPDGCHPLGLVLYARHGSRYDAGGADEGEIYAWLENLARRANSSGKSELCADDLQKIKLWGNWYRPEFKLDLSPVGEQEMAGLGQRFSQAFPQLFADTSRSRVFTTDFQRNRESARIFMKNSHNSSQSLIINDMLIKPHKYCDRYFQDVIRNEETSARKHDFEQGPVFTGMASNVSKRLGINDTEMDFANLRKLYWEGCVVKNIADGTDSPWCLVFTKQDFQAFEYLSDMNDYMWVGYGSELSHKPSCLTKQFISSALKNISDGDHLNQYLFGHYYDLFSLQAELRTIMDEGFFGIEDYPEKVNRTYRGSIFAPMSGNVAFLVNQCGDKQKLQVFHNEKPLSLPLNDPVADGTWDLNAALKYFGFDDPEDCVWNDICSVQKSPTPSMEQTTSMEETTSMEQTTSMAKATRMEQTIRIVHPLITIIALQSPYLYSFSLVCGQRRVDTSAIRHTIDIQQKGLVKL